MPWALYFVRLLAGSPVEPQDRVRPASPAKAITSRAGLLVSGVLSLRLRFPLLRLPLAFPEGALGPAEVLPPLRRRNQLSFFAVAMGSV